MVDLQTAVGLNAVGLEVTPLKTRREGLGHEKDDKFDLKDLRDPSKPYEGIGTEAPRADVSN